jgi:hypothetical protein
MVLLAGYAPLMGSRASAPGDDRAFPQPAPWPLARARAFHPEQVFSAAALTPERRVVVQCARALAGRDEEPSLAALLQCDPEILVPLAWRHGMLPALSRRVARADAAGAYPALAPLRAAFLENGVRALRLAGELADVVGILEAAGVVALAYKGPALAIQAYGDPSARDCGDLDLVVRKEELEAAGAALVAAGFRDLSGSPAERAATLRAGHHLAYRRGEVLVEVHWRFGKSYFGFAEEVSGLWERAEPLDIRGRRVLALSVPDHLIALAIHSSKAMWSSLDATVCMVRLAARTPQRAWPALVEQARVWRCEEALRVSLLLAEWMLGSPCRRGIAAYVPATPRTRRLVAKVAAELFLEEFGGRSYVLGQLALRPRYRDRVRFAVGALSYPRNDEGRGRLGAVLARLRRYWR